MLSAGRSSADLPFAHSLRLAGPARVVDHTRRLQPTVEVERVGADATAALADAG